MDTTESPRPARRRLVAHSSRQGEMASAAAQGDEITSTRTALEDRVVVFPAPVSTSLIPPNGFAKIISFSRFSPSRKVNQSIFPTNAKYWCSIMHPKNRKLRDFAMNQWHLHHHRGCECQPEFVSVFGILSLNENFATTGNTEMSLLREAMSESLTFCQPSTFNLQPFWLNGKSALQLSLSN